MFGLILTDIISILFETNDWFVFCFAEALRVFTIRRPDRHKCNNYHLFTETEGNSVFCGPRDRRYRPRRSRGRWIVNTRGCFRKVKNKPVVCFEQN